MLDSPIQGVHQGGNRKLRVLVVDDSPFFQRRISDILDRDPGIEVVGVAGDGLAAVAQVHRLNPDVVTMDVEMPIMDGISAVRRIMSELPTPVLMFSAMTREGARATLDALDAGALDFLPKQFNGTGSNTDLLPERIRTLVRHHRLGRVAATRPPGPAPAPLRGRQRYRLVVIGASTGGPVAIQHLLAGLPADFPLPVLVVVHMPGSFTHAYAERLDGQSRIRVKEAEEGDLLRPGNAYLAPGGRQMLLQQRSAGVVISIREGRKDQVYKPSVDITLGSAAQTLGGEVLGLILTGMGADGRQGAQMLKRMGGTLWSQDQASCVVYGMPQAVEKAGLSDRVLALDEMAPMLTQAV